MFEDIYPKKADLEEIIKCPFRKSEIQMINCVYYADNGVNYCEYLTHGCCNSELRKNDREILREEIRVKNASKTETV
jgi:hypothetical protein